MKKMVYTAMLAGGKYLCKSQEDEAKNRLVPKKNRT